MPPRLPRTGYVDRAHREMTSGPEEPLEPLAPSPYASVIYSAPRTRSKGGPKQLRRPGGSATTSRWSIPVGRGLRPSTSDLVLGDPGSPVNPGGRLGPGRKVASTS